MVGKKKILIILIIALTMMFASCKDNKKLTVSFDYGGNIISTTMVKTGSMVIEPKEPSKEGYTFLHWSCNDAKYDFNQAVTTDLTLVAKWEKKMCRVITNADEGQTIMVEYGTTLKGKVQFPQANRYKCVGFRNLYDTTDELYDLTKPVTGDVCLLPIWEKTSFHVVIVGDSIESYDVDFGTALHTIISLPEKEGYTFLGFKNALESSDRLYDLSTKIIDDTFFNCVWENKTYEVQIDSNNGTPIEQKTVAYHYLLDLVAKPNKEDAIFDYWMNVSDGSKMENDTLIDQNIKIQAVYRDYLKITFDANGGNFDGETSIHLPIGTKLQEPAHPTYPNKYFVGWCVNGNLFDFETIPNEDINLIAVYADRPYGEYATLYLNTECEDSFASIKALKGSKVELSSYVPTRAGYAFLGWTDENNQMIDELTLEKDTILHAKWKPIYVTIAFHTTDETEIAPVTIQKDIEMLDLDTYRPTKPGYQFLGWTTSVAMDELLSEKQTFSENTNLTAVWRKAYVNITFYTDGGTSIPLLVLQKDIEKIDLSQYVPTKSGCKFMGWSVDGTILHENLTFTKDTCLYATWKEGYVTITFNTNGGSSITPLCIEKGSTFDSSMYQPTKFRYKFSGWYLDAELKEKVPHTYIVENDMSVYAKWTENGIYQAKWPMAQQVGGWQGKGMDFKIMVNLASSFDPFNVKYAQSDKKVKQMNHRLVEAAYDIQIRYLEFPNCAAWGPERIQYIKNCASGEFHNNNVYILNINSVWIPALVSDGCLAPLYNMKEDSGIFTEIGYKEKGEGTNEYIASSYSQKEINNYATSCNHVVYGYVHGKARPDYFMYYNLDLILRSGLEDPAELWFKGEWTWSNFEKYVERLQTYLNGISTDGTQYKALALGYPEFFIGSCASTGRAITDASPVRLNLNTQPVVDQLSTLQRLVNSGVYDTSRGVADVAISFVQGFSAFAHGDLWFLKDPFRFDPNWKFEIGCVPYPTADGQGGEPIYTDDVNEAIYTANGQPLTDTNGQYIKGVDMSHSTFKVPFTSTDCYSIVNTPSGQNGINNKIIFAIIYDLFEGQGVNPDAPMQTEDEAYHTFLAQKKFDSEIYADVILSVQDCTYFELIEMISMSVGGCSQFGPNTLWMIIPRICIDSTKSPFDELESIYSIYYEKMRKMGYVD